jgi:hypothetical protein
MARGYAEVFRQLETGIRDGAARQLLTYHPTTYFRLGRGGSSTSLDFNPFGPKEKVLDFHMIQTYAWPDQVTELIRDAWNTQPTKPVVHAEGAYEAASDYPGLPTISARLARRQAWQAFLAGGFHTYGHTDTCCRYSAGWARALEAPGAAQLGILKSVLASNRWWTWAPSPDAIQNPSDCGASAAHSPDRRLLVLYYPEPCAVRLAPGAIAGSARLTWIDPVSGAQTGAAAASLENPLAPPPNLREDAVLLLRAESDREPPPVPEQLTLPLSISPNRRYFVDRDGKPFLWLGDTIWPLVAWSPEEAERYFAARKREGFTVVQTVAIVYGDERDPGTPLLNYRGEAPLVNGNPETPNERYFQHLDRLIQLAADHGLVVALLPAWGLYVTRNELITTSNARAYGRWVGARYRNRSNVVWVLGGDTSVWGYYRQQNSWKLVAKDAVCHNGITDALCAWVRGAAQRY